MKFRLPKGKKGQAMLIAVLSLGGAMLGVTTIAGLLILFQLRQTGNAQNSAKAIFAADGGLEFALYDFYCTLTTPPRCPPAPVLSSPFPNGAAVAVTCYDNAGAATDCGSTSTAATAISKGTALTSRRAFFLDIINATSALP
jgi:hypothetical protein